MATVFIDTPSATETIGFANGPGAVGLTYSIAQAYVGRGSWYGTTGAGPGEFFDELLGQLADAGRRIVRPYRFATALPSTFAIIMAAYTSGATATVWQLRLLSDGTLRLFSGGAYLGAASSTALSLGTWYVIKVSAVITSTSNFTIKVWVGTTLALNITGADGSLGSVGQSDLYCGLFDEASAANIGTNREVFMDSRWIDNSAAGTDPGAVVVTAKVPNGLSTNTFARYIDRGGVLPPTPRYAHVSQRPLNTAQGWQSGAAAQEETFTTEAAATGDADLTGRTIVAHQAWIYADRGAGTARTTTFHHNGSTTVVTLAVDAPAYFKQTVTDSATYPTGKTGLQRATGTGTLVRLYEAGIQVAYIVPEGAPATKAPAPRRRAYRILNRQKMA